MQREKPNILITGTPGVGMYTSNGRIKLPATGTFNKVTIGNTAGPASGFSFSARVHFWQLREESYLFKFKTTYNFGFGNEIKPT